MWSGFVEGVIAEKVKRSDDIDDMVYELSMGLLYRSY